LNESHKKRIKSQYDKYFDPRVYGEDKDALEVGTFNPMWFGPYTMQPVLEKGSYELVDFEVNVLLEPKYGLYLNNYYAYP
jgi:hypothetical protein